MIIEERKVPAPSFSRNDRPQTSLPFLVDRQRDCAPPGVLSEVAQGQPVRRASLLAEG